MQIDLSEEQEARAKALAPLLLDHPTFGISIRSTEPRRMVLGVEAKPAKAAKPAVKQHEIP